MCIRDSHSKGTADTGYRPKATADTGYRRKGTSYNGYRPKSTGCYFRVRSLLFVLSGSSGSFSVEPLCGREDRDAPASAHTPAPTPAHTTLSVVQQNNARFRGGIPVLLVVEWLGLLLVVV